MVLVDAHAQVDEQKTHLHNVHPKQHERFASTAEIPKKTL